MSEHIAAVFACDVCRHERKYGECREPETVLNPLINCEGMCNRPTRHTFIRVDMNWNPTPPRRRQTHFIPNRANAIAA